MGTYSKVGHLFEESAYLIIMSLGWALISKRCLIEISRHHLQDIKLMLAFLHGIKTYLDNPQTTYTQGSRFRRIQNLRIHVKSRSKFELAVGKTVSLLLNHD